MAIWVNLNRAAKFPEVNKVYKRAGFGQGAVAAGQGFGSGGVANPTGSAPVGFLQYVRKLVTLSSGAALPAWIRKSPAGSNDWQDVQVDVTAIPGVRSLNTNGKSKQFIA